MKNFEEFFEFIQSNIQARLPEEYQGYSTERQTITRSGLNYEGLVFHNEPRVFGTPDPVLNISAFYDGYLEGRYDEDEVLDKIVDTFISSLSSVKQNDLSSTAETIKNYDRVKAKIIPTFAPVGNREQYIKDKPIDYVAGLPLVYKIRLNDDMYIAIDDNIMALWDITKDQLKKQAFENLSRETVFYDMEQKVFSLFGKEDAKLSNLLEEEQPVIPPMAVLSNKSGRFGATAMAIPEVMMKISDMYMKECGQGFYIIPSSIQEVILVPQDIRDVEGLRQMVKEVNSGTVGPDEVLSDELYEFDAEKGEIKIVDAPVQERDSL